MDLEVVGRHALLFDDDTSLAFVNSKEALVPWNDNPSLLIDRYDVRHLLQSIPSARLRKQEQGRLSHQIGVGDGDGDGDGVAQSELDRKRFLDLPDEESCDEEGNSGSGHGGYQAVPFVYDPTGSGYLKDSENGFNVCGYRPSFSLPESLLNNLPPTEKVHQIIARTALFVSEHGGQSEIVLRVKQGDNPTFGFLMPDHHLHAYFRFLVDHPELLKLEVDGNDKQEEKADSGENEIRVNGGEALSLLGSIYSSGEEDESGHQAAPKSGEMETGISDEANVATIQNRSKHAAASSTPAVEAKIPTKHPNASNDKAPLSKKGSSIISASSGIAHSKTGAGDTTSISVVKDKTQPSAPDLILDPPSSLKCTVEKIVEFITRNGREFERVLIEQDRMNGRFPFLLPSNPYHSYYLKVLHEANEPKRLGKSPPEKKHGTLKHAGRTTNIRGPDAPVQSTAGLSEGFYDPERKEKFKMVIGGAKKDTHDAPPKPAKQSEMSADDVAAIVMAATRGLNYQTQLESLPKISTTDSGIGLVEGGGASSIRNFSSHHGQTSDREPSNGKSDTSLKPSVHKGQSTTSDVSIAKAIAKTAARATASEAESSEACLTKEQKQKAERLKRAKMFAAMIKSGQRGKNESSPTIIGNSDSHGGSTLAGVESDLMGRERESSSVPIDAETSDREDKTGEKGSAYYPNRDTKSRKRHVSRSRDHDESSEEDHKHSRKKHHSSRSSARHKHKGHSSKHKQHSPSEDEHRHRKRSKSRRHHRHHSSDDDDDEHRHRSNDHGHGRKSHSEKLEVDNIKGDATKSNSDAPSNDFDLQLTALPSVSESQPSNETKISDDLRAKVRAMLLSTM